MSRETVPTIFTEFGVIKLLCVGLICYVIGWNIYAITLHPLSKIPGPALARTSRFWMLWRVYAGDTDVVQRALHAKYGPVVRIAHDEVCCSDPEMIPNIYRTQAPLAKSDFYPPWNKKILSKYSDHFTELDERRHAERRRIVSHVYRLSNILRSEEYIDSCLDLLFRRLSLHATSGSVLDLGQWFQWFAFDAIGELFFGKMFGFMEKSADHESYIASLEALVPVICAIATAAPYSRGFIVLSSLLNPTVRKGLKGMDRIIHASRECVSTRVDKEGNPVEDAQRHDLLQQFLDIFYSKGEKLDFKVGEVQLEIWAALFAGSDTTAIAMRAVIYYLLKTPQIYSELQQEIDAATQDQRLSSPPRYPETLQLPLLCATIKEAMRIHPSAGFSVPRVSPEGGLLLAGYFVPAGYTVGMNAAVVGYDTKIFGSDAAIFNPHRWLTEDTRKMDKASLGFGAGTRTCLGRNISLILIHKVIPFIIQHFDIQLENPEAQWITNNQWLNKQSGLKVKLSPR